MLTDALILAGGLGTRLGKLTENTPKPILSVGGQPFLGDLLWNLERYGVKRAVISAGFAADTLRTALREINPGRMEIQIIEEPEPLGTGGAVRYCREHLESSFLVLNGDTLFDANLDALSNLIDGTNLAAIALRSVPDAGRYGSVDLDKNQIISFGEKSKQGQGLVSGGVYGLTQDALDLLPVGRSSIEADLFPRLAAQRQLGGFESKGFFIDIGVPETYEEAQSSVPNWRQKPIAFLDRDGVINVDAGYTSSHEGFQFVDEAPETIRWLNENGYLVVVVTNQAGIGRGYYSEDQFHEFMLWMRSELGKQGAHWDRYYFCPHHPTEGQGEYKRECDFRKPNPGMLVQAIADFKPDLARSFLIGDKLSDLEAADRAGVKGYLYEGANLWELARNAVCAAG